jgi:hypothetical protein
MNHPGWGLILIGGLLAAAGLIWMVSPGIPWLGRLPGDIVVERDNFRFYFPVATCVVLSLLLTGILWLVRLFTR